MSTKWLDGALKRQKQDAAPNGNGNGTAASAPAEVSHTPVGINQSHANQAHLEAMDIPAPQGDLQSVDDIYRAAGIMNPRMGYSIRKVVEMLASDHLRGLANDAKLAAVMMALDAAGITMDEVLRDARVRQNALEAYEARQLKSFEEHWTRKEEGNSKIKSELARVTAQFLDRIKRNQDEVALEKAAFAEWQKTKQQEAGRISEAVGICSKLSSSEVSSAPLVSMRTSDSVAKPS